MTFKEGSVLIFDCPELCELRAHEALLILLQVLHDMVLEELVQ